MCPVSEFLSHCSDTVYAVPRLPGIYALGTDHKHRTRIKTNVLQYSSEIRRSVQWNLRLDCQGTTQEKLASVLGFNESGLRLHRVHALATLEMTHSADSTLGCSTPSWVQFQAFYRFLYSSFSLPLLWNFMKRENFLTARACMGRSASVQRTHVELVVNFSYNSKSLHTMCRN